MRVRESKFLSAVKLLCCFMVIHVNTSVSVLIRGRILSPEYHAFNHPTFLVLASNLMSFLLAAIICRIRLYNYDMEESRYRKRISVSRKPPGTVIGIGKVPLLQFALMSVSDCLGRNLQITTRATTTFPLQIIGRSSRVLPTMVLSQWLLGRPINYSRREYGEVALASVAIAVFALSSRVETQGSPIAFVEHPPAGEDLNPSRLHFLFELLIGPISTIGYNLCDAFTWTWQSRIYREYHVDQYTVMFWLNVCQMTIIGTFLLLSGGGFAAITYLIDPDNVDCLQKIVQLALCSAVSQLMALYAIRRFGPLAFTALMSARQLIAVVISTLVCFASWSLDSLLDVDDNASSVASGIQEEAGVEEIDACASLLRQVRRTIPCVSILVLVSIIFSWIRRSTPLNAEMLSNPAEITVDEVM